MSFDQIEVSISDLQSVSAQFNNKAAELEQLLSQVQSQIESVSSTWRGQAASDFANLMAKWTTDVQGIHDVLGAVSQHLNQAASGYQETDTGIARGFQVN
ncbi:MAG: WXG100 family type VII secretion target [Chloroflexi bacterium]|nr:WXG100 family type VII secretion target [Ktedonobacteraceae bacterium]MBV9021667.1 WXG100 family type VII secretion target [Ktedonobacteraceae bacterium]MBV9706857.1 WXG100 family type VII secretion target [Chloroflexota bacterium]